MTRLELMNRVQEALWSDDSLDARAIRVIVQQGNEVWLEGEVPTPDMYDLAEHIASGIGGVGTLTNNLVTTDEPYDIRDNHEGIKLRMEPSTDVNAEGRLMTRIDPFGEEADEPISIEGDEQGGPVGGDSGAPIHPGDMNEVAPMAGDLFNAETPWRYQDDGVNASIDEEPVLPPDDNEV